MSRLIVDDPLSAELEKTVNPVSLYNKEGRFLGTFQPMPVNDPMVIPSDQCPYTDDALKRSLDEPGGRPLAEIWKTLGRT